MSHGYKKIHFKHGKDAQNMLLRQLTTNFILNGKITSSEKRVKVLKSWFDKLVGKAKVRNEANKNVLLRHLGDLKVVNEFFEQAKQISKDKVGGYVRIIKLFERANDGTMMNRLEWTLPIVRTKKTQEVKASKVGKAKEVVKDVEPVKDTKVLEDKKVAVKK